MLSAVTSIGPPARTSLAGRELERLRALTRELSSALAEIQDETAPDGPGSAGAQALSRLLRGEGRAQDELMLGIVVPHSRLLVVGVPDARHGQRLVDELGGEGRVVTLLHAADEALVLVPEPTSSDRESRGRESAERVVRQILRIAGRATIGISSPVQAVSELPLALTEARQVDRCGQSFAFADDQWAALGVARLAEQLGGCLTVSNPLTKLMQNDLLVTSVSAWLEHGSHVPAAAEALSVHPNTLRYRLRRVHATTGLDLTDPDALLLATLLLRRSGACAADRHPAVAGAQ